MTPRRYDLYRVALPAAIVSLLLAAMTATPVAAAETTAPVRLALAGLVHGHAGGFLRGLEGRADVTLVGIFEPEATVRALYAKRFGYEPALFFTDLDAMLEAARPDAVAAFTNTYDHPAIVEACAARRVHVMMEKPLAVSVDHAKSIRAAAARGKIEIVVNYETTWYPSHGGLWQVMKRERAGGEIRKMVAMDGHGGPKELGVGPEFLGWLTDPVKNGGGALYDFGCYGANLMTWLMDDERPLSVTARTQQIKPAIYPHVDDEATVVLEYPRAQGVIQASWNWPFNRKDLEVYGVQAYAVATGRDALRVRRTGAREETLPLDPLPADERDPISYLAIVRGTVKPAGPSSLETNMIVTEILEEARTSARTGATVRLTP
jgi:predicted dehydrogenase